MDNNNSSIDTSSLSNLINQFRQLQVKDSITPESLGTILQQIVDLLATAATAQVQQTLSNWYNNVMRSAPALLCGLQHSAVDSNLVKLTPLLFNVASGANFSGLNHINIHPATESAAGIMTAQHVNKLTDADNQIRQIWDLLNDEVRPDINDIGTKVNSVKSQLELVPTRGQIAVQVVDNVLHVYGATQLYSQGYVPYIFRYSRKRNRLRAENGDRGHGPQTKGWHLFGSRHSVKIENTVVMFSKEDSNDFFKETSRYSSDVYYLVHPSYDDYNDRITIPWGRASIRVWDAKAQKNRMIRLRYAIGFAKSINHGSQTIQVNDLVSNLAEFSVVYDPKHDHFRFSR